MLDQGGRVCDGRGKSLEKSYIFWNRTSERRGFWRDSKNSSLFERESRGSSRLCSKPYGSPGDGARLRRARSHSPSDTLRTTAMVLVYQEPLRVKYYAKWHSFPALFRVGNLLSVIAVALVTTYVTGSMWVKTRVSYEQPDVVFDSKLMMVLEGGETGEDVWFWSTLPNLNRAFESSFVSTDLSVTQEDYNFDGKVDTVRIKLRSSVGAAIRGVKILAQFDYKLRERVHMNMKTLAYVAHSGGVPGSALHADGSLSLRQREPLPDDSTRREYLEDLLRDSEPDGMLQASTELGVSSILEDYFFRNETTVLSENYASWEAGSAEHSGFVADVLVRVPPNQALVYKPSTIEILKFGWIQFLASFVVFFWLLSYWEWYVFHYRVLDTRMRTDMKSKLKSF